MDLDSYVHVGFHWLCADVKCGQIHECVRERVKRNGREERGGEGEGRERGRRGSLFKSFLTSLTSLCI